MKRPGYCTLCEKPVFEFNGERPILPMETAWRVEFLLSDDTSADITFCNDCLGAIAENMEKIWESCLDRFDYEETQRPGKTPEAVAAHISHLKEHRLVHEIKRMRWDSL